MSDELIDKGRRRFLLTATRFLGAMGAAFVSVPFLASWWPSARAQAAGAPVTVDVTHLEPGQQMTIEWRGRPVWIVRRTADMLKRLQEPEYLSELRDPDSEAEQQPTYADNAFRSIKPEYLVLVGVCTHLGCSPTYQPDKGKLGPAWPGGFFCPCHGSMFDLAGRVFKGVPAPINLEVPPYHFANDTTVVIGEGPGGQS